jgi:hypothetical protein
MVDPQARREGAPGCARGAAGGGAAPAAPPSRTYAHAAKRSPSRPASKASGPCRGFGSPRRGNTPSSSPLRHGSGADGAQDATAGEEAADRLAAAKKKKRMKQRQRRRLRDRELRRQDRERRAAAAAEENGTFQNNNHPSPRPADAAERRATSAAVRLPVMVDAMTQTPPPTAEASTQTPCEQEIDCDLPGDDKRYHSESPVDASELQDVEPKRRRIAGADDDGMMAEINGEEQRHANVVRTGIDQAAVLVDAPAHTARARSASQVTDADCEEGPAAKRPKGELGGGDEEAEEQQQQPSRASNQRESEPSLNPISSAPEIADEVKQVQSDEASIPSPSKLAAIAKKKAKKQRYKRNQKSKKSQSQQESAAGTQLKAGQESVSRGATEQLSKTSFCTSADDLKTALSKAYPDAFPWMIQRQFDFCERLFDDFIAHIFDYRTGGHESIEVTEEDWYDCNDHDCMEVKWPDFRGMKFCHDFAAAFKLLATHSTPIPSRTC